MNLLTILLPLAYYDAAGGIAAIFLILFWLFMIIYAIIAFLVPFFIYRIMRRTTENNEALRAILTTIRSKQ